MVDWGKYWGTRIYRSVFHWCIFPWWRNLLNIRICTEHSGMKNILLLEFFFILNFCSMCPMLFHLHASAHAFCSFCHSCFLISVCQICSSLKVCLKCFCGGKTPLIAPAGNVLLSYLISLNTFFMALTTSSMVWWLWVSMFPIFYVLLTPGGQNLSLFFDERFVDAKFVKFVMNVTDWKVK